ncbi:hypothetical protein ASD65_17790 [Microbacterium sp. Root61]|uniref:LmeA family phospholipid-binding protein n=1 Tax=Microbacterium sp. Root61 TaxID=1736570 RepID=UPI0006FD15F6|nr:DUF2993 domain-containing protein [Microbacterium sp. Root61]KRA22533.1 hypothetical protein ASD65_17790 [Microbacterium sp. Root61]
MSDTHPTEPLPDPTAQWILSTQSELQEQPQPKRRRKVWPWIVAVVAVLALAVGAWFLGEWIAKDLVAKTIRDQIVTRLALPADQEVDVQIEGMVIPQLLSGTLDDVTVSSDDVALGAFSGDVTVRAEGVPITGGAPATGGTATVRMDAAQVQALLSTVDGFPADSVGLDEPNVTMATDVKVLGLAVPVGVALTPGADAGKLVLTPAEFTVAGAEFNADALREQFGGLADVVLRDWTVCVAEYLPAGVSLTTVGVDGTALVADFAIDGRIVTDPALREKGTCA